MLNKKTYEILNRIKENTPDDYEIIQSSIDELLNELSFTSHEIKNHISFLYSSYQLMEYRHPEITESEFWTDMGNSFNNLINFMDRSGLYRKSLNFTLSSFCLNDLLYELPDYMDLQYNFENDFIFDTDINNLSVCYDKNKVKLAFTEIIANACEASKCPIAIKSYTNNDNSLISVEVINYVLIDNDIECNNDFDMLAKPFFTTKEQAHVGVGLSIAYTSCLAQGIGIDIFERDGNTVVKMEFKVCG